MNASDAQKAYAAWVLGLQPGDRVAVPRRSGWAAPYDLLTVERLTATLIVAEGGRTFRRTGTPGREVGAPGHTARLTAVTSDISDAVEEHKLRVWLRDLCHRPARVVLAQLRAMKAAYDAAGGAA